MYLTDASIPRVPLSGDKFERFEAWLRENGAQFQALELREYETDDNTDKNSILHGSYQNEEEKKEPTKETAEVQGDNEMRGVHARSSIPPNTVCMAIPRKCLITVEMGQATRIGQAIFHSDLDLDAPKHIFLMVFLLWDRKVNGSASFFHPYYEILPQTLQNMPIFWSPEELANLEGSHLLAQISDRIDAISEDYNAICRVAPDLVDICTLDEFKWARMCVCSRNFGLQIDGNRTSALVPHADMLNHYRPRETKWTFDDVRQAFTITTLQPIFSGAQVYDSYGQKCNHRFLLNYGFAVEENKELDGFCPNEVSVELGLSKEDPLYDLKVEFWTRGDIPSYGTNTFGAVGKTFMSYGSDSTSLVGKTTRRASASGTRGRTPGNIGLSNDIVVPPVKRVRICVANNENSRLLFSLLRAIVCSEMELRALGSASSSGSIATGTSRDLFSLVDQRPMSCRDIRHPLSLRNEKAAMTHLLNIASQALALYPTTLANDVSDLLDYRNYPRFSNQRHAKIQVKGEKEVLHHFLRWARKALGVIDVIDNELSENIKDTTHVASVRNKKQLGFDEVIGQMEDMEDEDSSRGVHHTIVRYCADVLGSLRRDEFKRIRKDSLQLSSSH